MARRRRRRKRDEEERGKRLTVGNIHGPEVELLPKNNLLQGLPLSSHWSTVAIRNQEEEEEWAEEGSQEERADLTDCGFLNGVGRL